MPLVCSQPAQPKAKALRLEPCPPKQTNYSWCSAHLTQALPDIQSVQVSPVKPVHFATPVGF